MPVKWDIKIDLCVEDDIEGDTKEMVNSGPEILEVVRVLGKLSSTYTTTTTTAATHFELLSSCDPKQKTPRQELLQQ